MINSCKEIEEFFGENTMGNNDRAMETEKNSIFTFVNPGCEVQEIQDYDENGNQVFFLNLKESGSHHNFVFQVGDGLVRKYVETKAITKRKGYPDEETEMVSRKRSVGVLHEFVKMDMSNTKFVAEYFRNNGYLFRLPETDRYNRVALADIQRIQYRMKLLQDVMQTTVSKQDKPLLLEQMSEILLFGMPRSPEKDCGNCLYIHPFTELLLANYDQKAPFNSTKVFDTFLGREEEVFGEQAPSRTYNEYAENDLPSSVPLWFREAVFNLYVETGQEDINLRFVIDFLYNLLAKYIDQLKLTRTACGYTITGNVEGKPEFDERFQNALVKTSRIVIKEELDYALKDIRNEVNLETLKPDSYIPDLYSALYMSIFYSRKYIVNPLIVEKCVKCGKLFTKRSSNTRKIYCGTKCKNAVSQAEWRKNHPKSEEDKSKAKGSIKKKKVTS